MAKYIYKELVTDKEIYVSCSGNDYDRGTMENPCSLKKAIEIAVGTEGIKCINISEGVYNIENTINLNIDNVYFKGLGNVTFYGGKEIKNFQILEDENILKKLPEKSRGKVYKCDLKSQGIYDFASNCIRGFRNVDPEATFELFVNNIPQSIVRYPKAGFMTVDNLIQSGNIKTGEASVFEYKDPKFETWELKDLWLFGYFRFLWADRNIKVTEIDKENKHLIMKEAYHWTEEGELGVVPDGMGNEQGIVYYAYNMIEELSEPREYYLDRDNGILYLVPDGDLLKSKTEINYLNDTMIKMKDCHNVRFENIHFDMGRRRCFEVFDSSNVELISCKISRFASDSFYSENLTDFTAFKCEVYNSGRGGFLLKGGDRKNLIFANNLIENCKLFNLSRIDRTYTPCVLLDGVGMTVQYNEMFDLPSSAMRVEGNEMNIMYNEFYNCLQESDDQGVIDVYFDFSYRNQIYKYNYFHNNGMSGRKQAAGQGAIRFDDAISGQYVYGNIIEKSATGGFGGVQINSGKDNIIENNLFIDCESAFTGGFHPYNPVWRFLKENKLPDTVQMSDLYFQRYPLMKNIFSDEGVNYYYNNILIDCKNMFPSGYMVNGGDGSYGHFEIDTSKLRVCKNNGMYSKDIIDEKYRVCEDVKNKLGFKDIPFEEIGNY